MGWTCRNQAIPMVMIEWTASVSTSFRGLPAGQPFALGHNANVGVNRHHFAFTECRCSRLAAHEHNHVVEKSTHAKLEHLAISVPQSRLSSRLNMRKHAGYPTI